MHRVERGGIANCRWFTQAEIDVYGQEYAVSGWT